nr:growth/differentiation factor 8 [Onthophagus taurus]
MRQTVLVLILFACVTRAPGENFFDFIMSAWKNPAESACTGCSGKVLVTDEDDKTNNIEDVSDSVDESALTALRVEYIKNQILKKLRLKEKPSVSADSLPKVIRENAYIIPKLYDEDDNYTEEYYAKTTRAVIFPYEDAARCIRKIRYPSACIPFQMSSGLQASDVSSAELWFYKLPDRLDDHNQTFVINEVAHWDSNKSFQKNQPLAIKETSITAAWLNVDVSYVVKNWLQYQDSPTHAINVVCKTCGNDKNQSPIAHDGDRKPFIVIYTHNQERVKQHNRNKRQTDCGPNSNECCREHLYISFADIGWNDWILHPPGYNAYYCKGSCETAASLTLAGSDHNHILNRIMLGKQHKKTTKLELKPCCAPTHYKPLQLLYMNDNKTITTKILPKMIVDSCGCM